MQNKDELVVGIGDIKIGKSPFRITTYLGSCIAVCLYSPEHKVGGILHLMMASSKISSGDKDIEKAKYADTGIPELLHQLEVNYKLNKKDFQAKIFGGAKVLKTITQAIGKNNEAVVRAILKGLGIKIVTSQTGGEKGYRLELSLDTGKVMCRIFGKDPKEF
ncbi:Chemotaxis protein CheD [hydrothermal vent metagenome]|uniref:Chemotaxis protein CheD n=1 Tax=hydrothermal vent metagenome TaxID=652676 RepID=A0A3B1DEE9_9ZZZZ